MGMIATERSDRVPPTLVIIHPGALGDVLLAVPALIRLRSGFSKHRHLLISTESVGRLLLDCRVIDAWIGIESAACVDLFAGCRSVSRELRVWLERCEFFMAWMKNEGRILETGIKNLGVREVRVRSPFARELRAQHQSDRFVETIEDAAPHPSVPVQIHIPLESFKLGETILMCRGISSRRPLVLIHPGSGSRAKCVRPDILASVIEQLQYRGIEILILEGPADREAVASLIKQTDTPPTVMQGLDLSTLAGLLAHAHLYIGHDSGITHLSALLGIPTLALFGPTDPDRWAPRGPHVTVLRGGGCHCWSWECVMTCAEKPCLDISSDEILYVCEKVGIFADATPRNPSCCTLSPPDPYAKVPR
jgi:heptosyltransferase-3